MALQIENVETCELVNLQRLPVEFHKDFDYVDAEDYSNRFFQYQGEWHDLYDMITTKHGPFNLGLPDEFKRWSSYLSETNWSGILARLVGNDDEQVEVATYTSS